MSNIADHIEPADWHALAAGAIAGLVCACAPSALALLLRWLA
jgi:hypothetical protein